MFNMFIIHSFRSAQGATRHETLPATVALSGYFYYNRLVGEKATTNHGEVSVQFLRKLPYFYMCSPPFQAQLSGLRTRILIFLKLLVLNVLEHTYKVVIAHPKYVKAIRGKKTDKQPRWGSAPYPGGTRK